MNFLSNISGYLTNQYIYVAECLVIVGVVVVASYLLYSFGLFNFKK